MKLIVGLGNVGDKYEKTRHNVGFMVLDKYLTDAKWSEKDNALYYKKTINNENVIFIKPTTFMNLSGNAVLKYVNYYKIDVSDILVIQDDLDMEVGSYKLKKDSSSGGHNGIKSIENSLNSDAFPRLKIGILDNSKKDVIDFVLGKFSKKELELIFSIDFNKIIDMFITEGYDYTINKYKS